MSALKQWLYVSLVCVEGATCRQRRGQSAGTSSLTTDREAGHTAKLGMPDSLSNGMLSDVSGSKSARCGTVSHKPEARRPVPNSAAFIIQAALVESATLLRAARQVRFERRSCRPRLRRCRRAPANFPVRCPRNPHQSCEGRQGRSHGVDLAACCEHEPALPQYAWP